MISSVLSMLQAGEWTDLTLQLQVSAVLLFAGEVASWVWSSLHLEEDSKTQEAEKYRLSRLEQRRLKQDIRVRQNRFKIKKGDWGYIWNNSC